MHGRGPAGRSADDARLYAAREVLVDAARLLVDRLVELHRRVLVLAREEDERQVVDEAVVDAVLPAASVASTVWKATAWIAMDVSSDMSTIALCSAASDGFGSSPK